MSQNFSTFEEFWPFYVGEHLHPATRKLHFVGTTLGVGVASCGYWAIGLVLAYGCAWIGHFGFEKNRPATFKHPLYSLRGDARMWRLIATGKMDAEITRLGRAGAFTLR
jgi:hypothetical protein